jgi:hypothetical protein
VRKLIVAGIECATASRYEAQAAVLNLEPAAVEVDDAMAVGVRDASFVEAEATEEHGGYLRLGGRRRSMP